MINDAELARRAANVSLVVFDVDGVLTDGRLYYADDGQEYKAFHSRDGHGLKMIMEANIEVAIITGRQSNVVTHRMQNLGIERVYQGQNNKLAKFEQLIAELSLKPEQAAYMGDDVVDLPVMRQVGLAVTVADAHELVCQHAHWITPSPGGAGAARELCELILHSQGHYAAAMRPYIG